MTRPTADKERYEKPFEKSNNKGFRCFLPGVGFSENKTTKDTKIYIFFSN